MKERPDELHFDGPGVHAIARGLSGSAIAADSECRRALGRLEFGAHAAGRRYRARGAAIEAGHRRLRRALDDWTAATNRHADALTAVADGYHGQIGATTAALHDLLGPEFR